VERLARAFRRTSAALWFAGAGVIFSVGVFFSGVFREESEFALVVMTPAFLAVAVLSALGPRFATTATTIAGLLAAVFLWFAREPRLGDTFPSVQNLVHAIGLVLAAGAAISAYRDRAPAR
jgi:hypothetical protein